MLDSLSSDAPGYLSLVVLAELVWVLRFSYRFNKLEIERVVEQLLRSRELVVEQKEVVSKALFKFRKTRADFTDCMIESYSRTVGCEYVLTFDKKAAASGMKLLPA